MSTDRSVRLHRILREQRHRVNATVMADPRLPCPQKIPESETPFDSRRMFWGGFGVRVER